MKPHLPVSLLRSLLSCLVVAATATLGSAATYPNGSMSCTTQQTSALTLDGYETICFKEISSSSRGGAIYNSGRDVTFTLCGNGEVSFSRNTTYGSGSFSGGAICNMATFTLSENGDVSFNGNSSSSSGGAIDNYNGDFTLNKNEKVAFISNTASVFGGAICNNATFMMSGNGDVLFSKNGGSPLGGAINNTGNKAAFTLCNNATLTFNGNTARSGGAIENSGIFVLRENGAVSFIGNTVTSSGGAIYNGSSNAIFTLCGNGGVSFSGNNASSSGGAIYNSSGNFSLNENEEVNFSENIGGAIVNRGTFTLSENENVGFSGNSTSSSGGAIYNEGIFTLSGDGAVTFSGNRASSNGGAIRNSGSSATFTLGGNGDVTFSENTVSSYSGGAIYNEGSKATFMLEGNGAVTFSGNRASSYGGAIYNEGSDAIFRLSGNGDVRFSENIGGAIYNKSSNATFTLSENGNVSFCENSVSSSGSAIYNGGTFSLSNNATLIFTGNTASNSGGAICNSGSNAIFTLSGNEDVTFSGNLASSYGGAIYNGGTFSLSNNATLIFTGNSATGSNGGAIYNTGTFTLRENGAVTFSGNTASSYGGAIYNLGSNAIFTLSGNGDVLFEKNAEICKDAYRLRSIYSSGTLNFSATAGKHILFKDSVYASGTVNLNQDGLGDIIFTGASTEADLREVKGGAAGTAQEITDSRNSVLDATVTLGGGTLQVRDSAELTVRSLMMDENATLVLRDASLTTTGDTTLSSVVVSGESAIAAQVGGALIFQRPITNNGVLTLSGTINVDALLTEGSTSSVVASHTYMNAAGQISTLGFYAEELVSCRFALTEGTGTVVGDSAHVCISDGILTVNNQGIASGVRGIDFSTYYLKESGESLSAILSLSPSAAVRMSDSVLTVDVNRDVTIIHDKQSRLIFTTGQTGKRTYSEYQELLFQNTFTYPGKKGGAMYNYNGNDVVSITENRHVSFIGNEAGYGGAVFNEDKCSFSLCDNDEIQFIGNKTTLPHFFAGTTNPFFGGGAIANDGSCLIGGNGRVSFAANSADRFGGAIYTDHGPVIIEGNGSVTFSGNMSELQGGAVYNLSRFSLKGNGDVLFEKNAEIEDGAYRLRSIYAANLYRIATTSLSAPSDCRILFRDSVYAEGAFHLNPEGAGDIIFSGATTEADLLEVKGAAGTAEEIQNSRTSEIATMTYLYGGRLIVEDMAVMQGHGITVTENSGATVRVKDATLNHDGYALTFASGTTLESEGISTITASVVELAAGSTLSFVLGSENRNKAVLKLNGNLAFADDPDFVLLCDSSLSPGTYRLITLTQECDLSGINVDSVKTQNNEWVALDAYWSRNTFYVELGRQEPGYVLLNAARPAREEDWGVVYDFDHTSLKLQGDWKPSTRKPGDMISLNWKGDSGEHLELTGQGCIESDYGWLYCFGGDFSIGRNVRLKNTSLSADGGSTVTFNGSVELEASSWPMQFNVWEHSVLDISNADLSAEKGALMLYLNGGRVVCSSYVVDAHHLLNYSQGINGGECSWKGSLTLGNEGRVCVTSTACSVPLAVEGDILVEGNTVFLGMSDMEGWTEGITLMTCTGEIIGDTSLLRVGVYAEGSYSPLDTFETSNLWVSVVSRGDGYALVTSETKPLPRSQTLTWKLTKGVWSTGLFTGTGIFRSNDTVLFPLAAVVTISGSVEPGRVEVSSRDNVTFTADKKSEGSGICGEGRISKSGAGVLTLNAGNTYSGGTELNAGTIKATAADSFGSGKIIVNRGTLDLAGKAVENDIILNGAVTLKGDAKYIGSVRVAGEAFLLAKTSYKSTTTIGEDSSLTLTSAATLAGNVALEGGTLIIDNAKGMTLAKNQTLTLDGGAVKGLVTVGAGGTLAWQEGTMQNAPVLKGGTLDLGGKNALTLTGVKAQVQFGDKVIDLPGKGIVRSDETLNVLSGTVKLTAGAEHADIKVSGNAALVNGATHRGNITVDGTLAKGTTIKLIDAHQTVELNGAGSTAAAISGIGTVNVNASIDATAAKLTAANLHLNSGTFTNTKGIKLAKGQTLTLNGANVNLGTKGILTTAAGSTLKVSESATLSGSLTLGGGDLVFEGAALTVKGTLTLSKPVSVTGSGTLICDSVKPFKGDLGTLFGGADVKLDGTTLTINGGATKKSLVAAPVAEEEAPLVAAPALPTLPEMPAINPVADAIAQADWGILDANRAFTGAVNTRHQHAALLDKGRGAAWVSAFGASVRHGNQGAHHGSDGNIEGAALGMEHSVSETGVLGLAVGRSKNRIGATGVTHLRQETAHVALYGQKQFKHNLTADATAAWGDTETKLGGSSWQQKSAALSGRLTHAHMVNDVTAVRTFGGLSYEATDSASIGSGSVQNLRAEVGAGATHTAGKAHFYGEASLTCDLIRHNPSVELGGLRHHGASPGRLGVKGTFGALYSFTDTWTGTASYSIEAESRTTAHTLNLGVSKSF